jgi:phosphopentomutase
VGRVIARPFIDNSDPGKTDPAKAPRFQRTKNRRDFSVAPPKASILDHLKSAGFATVGIGKIGDIFAHQGLTEAREHMRDNAEGMGETLKAVRSLGRDGLIFTNLVDTDMLFGHRNDCPGFRTSLEAFDRWLPNLLEEMSEDDLLILTADHGIDPTTPSTDHSREYVPILVAGKKVVPGVNLGTRKTFADIAKTIDDYFELGALDAGESFLPALLGVEARAV